jgi:hypothetical protein
MHTYWSIYTGTVEGFTRGLNPLLNWAEAPAPLVLTPLLLMMYHVKCYNNIIQKAEGVVPLENILNVTSIDGATAEPYQFKIFIEGKKAPEVWTLKARTEASQVYNNHHKAV